MNKKLTLTFGALLVVSPIITVVSCGDDKPSDATAQAENITTTQMKRISDRLYNKTTLSTRTSINEEVLGQKLSPAYAKTALGYDITDVDFEGLTAQVVAQRPAANSSIATAWPELSPAPSTDEYKFYELYIEAVNVNSEIVFKNRFPYVLIVTSNADVRAMFNEAKRLETAINEAKSTKNTNQLNAQASKVDFNTFKTNMGLPTSLTMTDGIDGKFYTDATPFEVPGATVDNVAGKQFRVRFHLKKNNIEFYNFNSLFHERTLIKSSDFVKMDQDQAATWYRNSESTRWTNLTTGDESGDYEFLNVFELEFAAGQEISKAQLSKMVKNYDHLIELEREASTIAEYGITTKFIAKEAITSTSTSMKMTIQYFKNGTQIPSSNKEVTIREKVQTIPPLSK